MNKNKILKNVLLVVVVAAIVVVIIVLNGKKVRMGNSSGAPTPIAVATPSVNGAPAVHTSDYATLAKEYPAAIELVDPDGYINTGTNPDGTPQKITIGSLIGKKVILLDFWTYSCINCQRTIPYLNAWYQKYANQGLEIIGVHTPEFDFEKDPANVAAAVKKFGILYPVVLDNGYKTWDAYHNEYWPEEYLIDINGLVVDKKIGEGNYASTETEIQTLLNQRYEALGESTRVTDPITDVDTVIDANSPETYFGFARNEYLANGIQNQEGNQTLTIPATIMPNSLYLGGTWDFEQEYAQTVSTDATIEYQYDAKNVYFVASSSMPSGTSITVLRDGKVLGDLHGSDLDANGNGTITSSRLYNLVNEQVPGTHTLEIQIHGAGLQAFTFTFG